MISNGSYELSTFSTSIKAEMKRLDSQIDLFWEKERCLYNRFVEGLQIVDLGCGTGHLIDKISAEYPFCKFTGVEQDPQLVNAAIQRLQNNLAVEQIINSSIEHFNPQSKKFDIAIVRLVLEHVPDPLQVLNKIHSILKANGKIIVIDNDFDYHLITFPEIAELKDLYNAYKQSRMHDGGDPNIGRRLPVLLKKAGFHNISVDILSAHSQISGDLAFINSEGGAIPTRLIQSGFLQENIFDSLVKKWKNMLNTTEHCLFRQLFAVCGDACQIQCCDSQIKNESSDHQLISSIKSTAPLKYREFLNKLIASTLNIASDRLNENQPLIDAGLDSVGALDIQNAVQEAFQTEISISTMLGGATLSHIAQILKKQLDNRNFENSGESILPSDKEDYGSI